MVRRIAGDKSRQRFTSRPEGAEVPREVFMAAVDTVAEELGRRGWRYARSGPHATIREGALTAKIAFASSTLNVADELVGLHVTILIADRRMAVWRATHGLAQGWPQVVARHLGHLLDPPVWLDWNLADRATRQGTVDDVWSTLASRGLPYVADVVEALGRNAPDLEAAERLLDPEPAIEYRIRDGDVAGAASRIDAVLHRMPPPELQRFRDRVGEYRTSGLVDLRPTRTADRLADLTVRFDIPLSPPEPRD